MPAAFTNTRDPIVLAAGTMQPLQSQAHPPSPKNLQHALPYFSDLAAATDAVLMILALCSCRQADPLGIAKLVTSLNLSPRTEVRAILEHPMPNALNGKWSWFSTGYNSGIWKGVLFSHGIPFESVSAKVWKTDMQLINTGKEGSRELAQHLLPQTIPQLKYGGCPSFVSRQSFSVTLQAIQFLY